MSHKTSYEVLQSTKRIVIKIGSVLITDPQTGTIRSKWLEQLAKDIHTLKKKGCHPLIVSSGAIALGRNALGLDLKTQKNKLKLEQQQAAAAVGSIKLSEAYSTEFSKNGDTVGLVLLSPRQTEERRAHLNARSTINTMLESGITPIINENDTVATSEIRFGDNDRLAARVAQMIGADTLVLLSTIDGLYTDSPEENPAAQHIKFINTLTDEHSAMANDVSSGLSTGGMTSKLIAAKIAMQAGCNMIIADGRETGCLHHILTDKNVRSTLFKASDVPINARKKWIMSHLKPSGTITIDSGAYKALQKGNSLLPVGTTEVRGDFARGDAVNVISTDGKLVAYGLTAYDSDKAKAICGTRSDRLESILGYTGREEMIHRDNLVLIK